MYTRGALVSNPEGGLPEIISPYLRKLIKKTGGAKGPIGLQFVAQPAMERKFKGRGIVDPFEEDKNEVAPGLVYRYRGKVRKNGKADYFGRALWTVTRYCASYCRFCFRGREVGRVKSDPNSKAAILRSPILSDADLKKVFKYIADHPELNEVILSGGDPFFTSRQYLEKIIHGLVNLQKKQQLDIVRFGTRLPIQNPKIFKDWHYKLVGRIKNPYILLHVNHPLEITPEVLKVLYRLRKESLATILSQTVLLKGVNDSAQVLQELFNKLTVEGVRPYYLFQNDPVYWADHFTVPIPKAMQIWSTLRRRLSGIAATAKFTLEKEGSFGKIPVPEGGSWKFDESGFKDFKGKWIDM